MTKTKTITFVANGNCYVRLRKNSLPVSLVHVHSWHSIRFVIASMRSMVFECLENFLCFCLSSRTSPLWKHSVLFYCGPTANRVCTCKFNPRNILQQYFPRNTVAKFYPNCFLVLLFSDQMISLDYYHPWSVTNSARSFIFQPVQFWPMKRFWCRTNMFWSRAV